MTNATITSTTHKIKFGKPLSSDGKNPYIEIKPVFPLGADLAESIMKAKEEIAASNARLLGGRNPYADSKGAVSGLADAVRLTETDFNDRIISLMATFTPIQEMHGNYEMAKGGMLFSLENKYVQAVPALMTAGEILITGKHEVGDIMATPVKRFDELNIAFVATLRALGYDAHFAISNIAANGKGIGYPSAVIFGQPEKYPEGGTSSVAEYSIRIVSVKADAIMSQNTSVEIVDDRGVFSLLNIYTALDTAELLYCDRKQFILDLLANVASEGKIDPEGKVILAEGILHGKMDVSELLENPAIMAGIFAGLAPRVKQEYGKISKRVDMLRNTIQNALFTALSADPGSIFYSGAVEIIKGVLAGRDMEIIEDGLTGMENSAHLGAVSMTRERHATVDGIFEMLGQLIGDVQSRGIARKKMLAGYGQGITPEDIEMRMRKIIDMVNSATARYGQKEDIAGVAAYAGNLFKELAELLPKKIVSRLMSYVGNE